LADGDFERGAQLVDEARITAAIMVADVLPAIERLAYSLLRRGRLTGADVRAVAAKYGLWKAPAARAEPRASMPSTPHGSPRAMSFRDRDGNTCMSGTVDGCEVLARYDSGRTL
jgi:hypothetical protein